MNTVRVYLTFDLSGVCCSLAYELDEVCDHFYEWRDDFFAKGDEAFTRERGYKMTTALRDLIHYSDRNDISTIKKKGMYLNCPVEQIQ